MEVKRKGNAMEKREGAARAKREKKRRKIKQRNPVCCKKYCISNFKKSYAAYKKFLKRFDLVNRKQIRPA